MTGPDIVVMYEGLNLIRVKWEDRETLRRDGVLMIALIYPGAIKRYQHADRCDWYHLIWNEADTACFLGGHDGDRGFYQFDDPSIDVDWRFPYLLPENCIEFVGEYTSREEWKEALEIYGDPEGPMFK